MSTFLLVQCLVITLLRSSAAVFLEEPKDQTITTGSSATVSFKCEVDEPNSIYSWRKDKKPLDTSDSSKYRRLDGTLDILNPVLSDAGLYQCVVTNQDGIVVSNYGNLQFAYINDFAPGDAIVKDSYVGNGIALPCEGADFSPKDQVIIFWESVLKPSLILMPGNETHYVSPLNGTLYMSNLKQSNADIYKCRIQSLWAEEPLSKTSNGYRLNVRPASSQHPLEFLIKPKSSIEVERGGKTLLECYAKGNPTPILTWKKIGGVLPENAIVTPAGQLLLNNTSQDMTGKYTCTASNSEGSNSLTAETTVKLAYKPQWDLQIESTSVDLSGIVSLTCTASAVPPPQFVWLKNGDQNFVNAANVKVETAGSSSVLTISNAAENDQAIYQCIAGNNYGNLFSSAKLSVVSKPPEIITKVPDKTPAIIGSDILIQCEVTGAPKPEISWTKNEQIISMDGQKYTMEFTGSLTVHNVSKTDEGKYICRAVNTIGSKSSSGYLIVYEPTVITKEPEDIRRDMGDSGKLVCAATHDKELNLIWSWTQDGNPLPKNLHYDPQGATLLLKKVTSQQSGIYKCCAKAGVGSDCVSAKVTVIAVPEPPENIRVSSLSAYTQEVVWDEPNNNGVEILRYVLEGKNEYQKKWLTMNTVESNLQNSTNFIVENLLPYNAYSYRVAAVNGIGQGKFSDESDSWKTFRGTPCAAPTNVGGGGGDLGQLIITWKPINQTCYGSDNIWYIVEARKSVMAPPGHPMVNISNPDNEQDSRSWSELRTKVSGGQANQHIFSIDLSEVFVAYEVRVFAENSEGEGITSDINIVYTAELAPTRVPTEIKVKKLYAYTADISWNYLFDPNGNARGYNVSICEASKNCDDPNNVQQFNTTSTFIKIDNLVPNTNYKLRMAGYNLGGTGPWSSPSWDSLETYKFTTPGPPPDIAPIGVRITVKDQSLTARWKPVKTRIVDNEVTGYMIEYWLEKDESIKWFKETDQTEETFDLPGKDDYYVWVRAMNKGGPGRPSQKVLVSTNIGTTEKYYGGYACVFQSSFTLVISSVFLWVVVNIM